MRKSWKNVVGVIGVILVLLLFVNHVKSGITEQDWTGLIRFGVIVFIIVLYNIYKEHKKKKNNN